MADQLGAASSSVPPRAVRSDRRGPPARRRATPAAGLDQSRPRRLRPGVRLRDRAHRQGRSAPDVRRDSEDVFYYRPSTTSRSSTRLSRRRRRRRGHPQGHPPHQHRDVGLDPAQIMASGAGVPVGPWRPSRSLAQEWNVRADVVRDLVERTAPRGSGGGAPQPAAPRGGAAHAHVTQKLSGAQGPFVAVSRLDAVRPPTRSPAGCRARTQSLGADGFGLRGHSRAPRAASSTSTRSRSWSRSSRSSRVRARSTARS